MKLSLIEKELIQAKPAFETISPSWTGLIRHRLAKVAGLGFMAAKKTVQIAKGKDPAEVVGEVIAGQVTKKMCSPIRTRVTTAHRHVRHIPRRDLFRKNGIGGRGWIYRPGQHPLTIIFHDANKAGPHVDVHIGRVSLIYRVKPHIYSQLKYNNQGMLTQASKDLLLDFVREEIDNGARVPQNLDHTISNARASWTDGDPEADHYGAGRTRQIVAEDIVDVYKANDDGGPFEFYAPLLNPHRGMYIYSLYPGDDGRAPILIWGNLSAKHPILEDRLRLKLHDPSELDELEQKTDLSTSTAKYDGSSCYIVINKKGTTVWSPRISKQTGERIEYTFKLDGLAEATSDETIVAMGELLFKERGILGHEYYLPQAEGSGILNSNKVLPKGVIPEVRLYRVDRVGRTRTRNLSFWENRELQKDVAKLSDKLEVVDLMSPAKAHRKGFEGVVAVPPGASVNGGRKVKFWQDPDDWRIDHVDFSPGPRGGIAGVVRCTSLESGRSFKLGPGQVGENSFVEEMMNQPDKYEGRVLKVASRHGHEGRAAVVMGLHDDK